MPSVRRVLAVTAGLAAAGFVVGAVLGAVVAGAFMAVAAFEPGHWDVGVTMTATALMGGLLGMVLGPMAAWLLMRHVPIGRALAHTALGTAVGAAVGFLPWTALGLVVPFPPLTLALLGFTAAAVRLRLTHRKKDAVAVLPPED